MKKVFILQLLLVLFFSLFSVNPVNAENGVSVGNSAQGWRGDVVTQMEALGNKAQYGQPNDPRLVVGYIIQTFLATLGVLFVALMVYAGFLIMTSQGEEEKRKKAIGMIRTSIIGVFILLGAYGIAYLAQKIITGQGEFPTAVCSGGQCGGLNVQQPVRNNNGDPLSEDLYQGNVVPNATWGN